MSLLKRGLAGARGRRAAAAEESQTLHSAVTGTVHVKRNKSGREEAVPSPPLDSADGAVILVPSRSCWSSSVLVLHWVLQRDWKRISAAQESSHGAVLVHRSSDKDLPSLELDLKSVCEGARLERAARGGAGQQGPTTIPSGGPCPLGQCFNIILLAILHRIP